MIRGQQQVASCLAHEHKHCLTVLHFRNCQGHDARRQPNQVEIPQFHFLELIAACTRSVKFVLTFLGVEQSPPGLVLSDITRKQCKHDCSQSPDSRWQVTTWSGRVHGVADKITTMVVVTVDVLVMTGVLHSLVFFIGPKSRHTDGFFQKPSKKHDAKSRNTACRFLRPSKQLEIIWRCAGRRDGGEEEESSAGLTMFAACQSNVFCGATRHAAWNIVWKPVL